MSAPEAMAAIEDLEKKYELNLAAVIMKIMIKDIGVNNLAVDLAGEFSINKDKAQQLDSDLIGKILFRAADYLGIEKEQEEKKPISIPFVKIKENQKKNEKQTIQADDLLFSSEDEEEIKGLAQKINGDIKKSKLSDSNIQEKLDQAITEAGINFGSDLLSSRFTQILRTYFRGIRDRISAKQALIKSIELGGLGFDNDSVEKVLKIADGKIKNLNEIAQAVKPPERISTPDLEKEKLTGLQANGVRDIGYDLSALKKQEVKATEKAREAKPIAKLDTKHEIAPPPPAIYKGKPKQEEPIRQKTDGGNKSFFSKLKQTCHDDVIIEEAKPERIIKRKEIAEQAEEAPIHKIKQVDARQVDEAMGKIKMDDIKFTPKSMGPVDELKYMDMVSFRRLCKTPEDIIHKIKEKINLLEEESYAKRLYGVKAWRQNSVNKIYLEIGHESINKKKPINAIIEERKAAGKDYLNNQEFEAITDLNRDLRF